jgi:hypothetical protein
VDLVFEACDSDGETTSSGAVGGGQVFGAGALNSSANAKEKDDDVTEQLLMPNDELGLTDIIGMHALDVDEKTCETLEKRGVTNKVAQFALQLARNDLEQAYSLAMNLPFEGTREVGLTVREGRGS